MLGRSPAWLGEQPARSLDLYGEKLGIRLALAKTFDERGVRLLFFRIGGTTLEVGARVGAKEAESAAESDVLWGVAYDVPDADAARARMLAAEVEVSSVRAGHKPGTRVCSVKSHTHGVPTLLIGPEAPGSKPE
jgi:catechol 2,3-dioxygenase-like lactoylglutathione lyase family enzyme